MGKSNKKKRRKARQRKLSELTVSTFGALNLSSKNDPPNGNSHHPPSQNIESDSLPDSETETDEANHQMLPKPSPYRNESPVGSINADTFGSASSRTRTLPTVTFVYPKESDSLNAVTYVFGTSDNNASGEAQTITNNSSQINHIIKKSEQSIDDILYQRVGANQANQTSLPANTSVADVRSQEQLRPRNSSDTAENHFVNTQHQVTHRSPYLSGISVEEAVRDKAGLRPRANSTDGELKLPQRGLCDERKVLECYIWKGAISGNGMPKGFNNLGNTCFLNSTLQCLAYCPPFCQSLMDMPRSDNNNQTTSPSDQSKKVNHGRMFTLALAALFRRLHTADNSNGAMSPRRIVNALPLLGSSSTRRNGYKFRPGRQEDAHEFLVHLLDAMNDGELREAGIDANKSGWRDRLPVPRLDETTFVHRIFGGYLRSQVRCTDCGYRSNTYDPFLDLSLEISRNSCHSISSAFNEFTRKETLDSQNRWKCSGCKKRVCATKQLTVFRPPLSLCIQLKRFTFGGMFGGGKKISKPVEFPAELQLPLSDGRSCGYALTGIVIHIGGSASSGHYTAYVQRPDGNGNRKWFHMDDSFVQPVSEQHVLRQHNAYVIMYCRQEVRVEFPTPPLRGSMTAEEAKELVHLRHKARSSIVDQSTNNNDIVENNETESSTIQIPSRNSSPSLVISQKGGAVLLASDDSSKTSIVLHTKKPLDKKEAEECVAQILRNGTINCTSSVNSNNSQEESKQVGEPQYPATEYAVPNSTKRVHYSPESTNFLTASQLTLSNDKISPSSTEKTISSDSVVSKLKDILVDPPPKPTSNMLLSNNIVAQVKSTLACVSMDRGENGKVEVVMRSHYSKQPVWLPKALERQKKDDDYDLLGNIPVSKWDDEDDEDDVDEHPIGRSKATSANVRSKIAKEMQKAEQDRKRKMLLDRNDAFLDQGKVR
jgi:ubiquitin C-terminal hydrolase